jgi:hypothetical protein
MKTLPCSLFSTKDRSEESMYYFHTPEEHLEDTMVSFSDQEQNLSLTGNAWSMLHLTNTGQERCISMDNVRSNRLSGSVSYWGSKKIYVHLTLYQYQKSLAVHWQ